LNKFTEKISKSCLIILKKLDQLTNYTPNGFFGFLTLVKWVLSQG